MPAAPVECVWHGWMAAEARACAEDYDGLEKALMNVL